MDGVAAFAADDDDLATHCASAEIGIEQEWDRSGGSDEVGSGVRWALSGLTARTMDSMASRKDNGIVLRQRYCLLEHDHHSEQSAAVYLPLPRVVSCGRGSVT